MGSRDFLITNNNLTTNKPQTINRSLKWFTYLTSCWTFARAHDEWPAVSFVKPPRSCSMCLNSRWQPTEKVDDLVQQKSANVFYLQTNSKMSQVLMWTVMFQILRFYHCRNISLSTRNGVLLDRKQGTSFVYFFLNTFIEQSASAIGFAYFIW